jgi:hypothetical protein
MPDTAPRSSRFPLGAAVELAELNENPYAVFARLREQEPISWLPALNMWYVTRYDDVRAIMLDTEHFTTVSGHSLSLDTFGTHLLTTERALHDLWSRFTSCCNWRCGLQRATSTRRFSQLSSMRPPTSGSRTNFASQRRLPSIGRMAWLWGELRSLTRQTLDDRRTMLE